MAAYMLIEGGVAVNRIEVEDPADFPDWTLLLDDGTGKIGDLWDGEAFTSPAPVVRVPATVTHRQGRAVLINRDLLATVEAVIDAIPGKAGALARNDFERSQEWRRDWPLIAQLQPALGWSDEFVDGLFIEAETL